MNRATVMVCADLHVGSRSGITPPDYWWNETGTAEHRWFARLQRLGWRWLMDERAKMGRVDLLLVDGDAVDGPEEKNGGRELSIPDLAEQVHAAAETIRALEPDAVALVRGSRYHVGKAVFLEDELARELGVPVPLWENRFRFAGKIFALKHKISKTSLPHTSYTPIAKECVRDLMNSVFSGQEVSDLVIRAHVHHWATVKLEGITGVALPGMQFETDYGAAECGGTTHFGFLEVGIEGGDLRCVEHKLAPREYARPVEDVTRELFGLRSERATKPTNSGRSSRRSSRSSRSTRTGSRPKASSR